MRNRFLATLALTSLTGWLSAQPIRLHPDNPHYFSYQGKPTVLITSGEHYGAVLNLDFDFITYLNTLQKDGLNLTRTFTGAYREAPGDFGIEHNTMAPETGRFVCPWPRSEQAGYALGGNKFDLSRWDEAYFNRLKDFVGAAEKRGIIVELALFCPFYEEKMWVISPMNAANNVNSVGTVGRNDVYTLDKNGGLLAIQEAMVRKIVTELNGFSNVLFEICNEPYFGGVQLNWQHHIADLIVETETSLPNKHLITQNIANGSAKIEKPHPAVSVFNFHYATPPKAVPLNYGLNKVLGDNETGFKGTADSTYRKEGWEFLLAGGGLYNNLDYSFTSVQPNGTYTPGPKSPGGGSPAFRKQLGVLKDFMQGLDFVRMKPDTVLPGGSLPSRVRVHALSETGKQYALYVYNGNHPKQPESMDLTLNLPAGRYTVTYVEPETGRKQKKTLRHSGGLATLKTPAFGADLALAVKTR
ncbi:cellulase family glycosylhydrolase [Larkinella humicola]|uniref:Cellulase family glycosylhydrolase n=1 Tax=Larkinella humicola TaxID=2607654 RepID=A0A5N1J782_9BACT|nr:cellulase family glycosylhydrolase [Larkinella humicola]KAA9346641.1 cellulase family glycosylhydrolase [Larkinella humicola]